MAKKKSKKQRGNFGAIAAVAAAGIGVLGGLLALRRFGGDGSSGAAGAIDRALGKPSGAAADGGSTAADLGLDRPHPGPGDRAPQDFRPDPTAGVSDERRDAFAPATMPNPASAEPTM
ncbi:MAG TPA: hypothetical protein VE567_02045 [Sphingomonas sp.]|nr:hypothetical protein [Sphingomonas sp.]